MMSYDSSNLEIEKAVRPIFTDPVTISDEILVLLIVCNAVLLPWKALHVLVNQHQHTGNLVIDNQDTRSQMQLVCIVCLVSFISWMSCAGLPGINYDTKVLKKSV